MKNKPKIIKPSPVKPIDLVTVPIQVNGVLFDTTQVERGSSCEVLKLLAWRMLGVRGSDHKKEQMVKLTFPNVRTVVIKDKLVNVITQEGSVWTKQDSDIPMLINGRQVAFLSLPPNSTVDQKRDAARGFLKAVEGSKITGIDCEGVAYININIQ